MAIYQLITVIIFPAFYVDLTTNFQILLTLPSNWHIILDFKVFHLL